MARSKNPRVRRRAQIRAKRRRQRERRRLGLTGQVPETSGTTLSVQTVSRPPEKPESDEGLSGPAVAP